MDAKIEKAKLKIEDIKPNPKNPKKHSDELIEQSIKEFGVVAPIIVDENNMVLAGHGRLNALIKLGYKEIEVIVKKGLTEEQKEKYMLLDNKLTERGGWDAEFPWYFSDGSVYHKLRVAGYEFIESGLPVKHEPSQTIKSDSDLAFLNSMTFPLYEYLYSQMWGGSPGKERFKTAFNR